MSNREPFVVATYNVLDPFLAVKHSTQAGLSDAGKAATPEEIADAINDSTWKKYSNWDARVVQIASNIGQADIVCLQEVTEDTVREILDICADTFKLVCFASHNTGSLYAFGNAIIARNTERFCVKCDPETPVSFKHSIVSRHTTDAYRSAAHEVITIDGVSWLVVSAHITGYNPTEKNYDVKQESKLRGHAELRDYILMIETEKRPDQNVLFAGDFNEGLEEESFPLYRPRVMYESGYTRCVHNDATEPSTGRKLDWIFYKQSSHSPARLRARPEAFNSLMQRGASDHLMVGVRFF